MAATTLDGRATAARTGPGLLVGNDPGSRGCAPAEQQDPAGAGVAGARRELPATAGQALGAAVPTA